MMALGILKRNTVRSVAIFLVFGMTPALGEETGVTDTEVLIGSHLDLSGPIAGWGIQLKAGMDMKAREIQEAGGIHGRKVRLAIEDSGYDPKKAVMATAKLINLDRVFCFAGNLGSATAGATLAMIIERKIPHLFPVTPATIFFEPFDRYKFALFVPYYSQARALVKYFVEAKKLDRIGLLYQDDEMGMAIYDGVRDQLAAYKLETVAAESYKRGATDFSSQIAKLRKTDAQLLVLATVIRETVGALKEVKKIGWKVDVCALIPAFTKDVLMLAMQSGISAEGTYCTGQTPLVEPDSALPFVREWYGRHREWYGKEPEQQVWAGYSVLHFFAVAAERAGRELTRETLVDALETFRDVPDPFGGPPLTFTKTNHLGADRVFMGQVQGGKFVKISDFIDYRQ